MKNLKFVFTFLLLNIMIISCSSDEIKLQKEEIQKNTTIENKDALVVSKDSLKNASISIVLPDGRFFATAPSPNGKAYFVFEGKPRHIQSIQTLNGLFANTGIPTDTYSYLFYSTYINNLPTIPFSIPGIQTLGLPLKVDNGLVHHLPTGKIYFREGAIIRYIPTIEIFNKYHFNMSALTNTNNISMFTIGTNVH